MVIVALTSLHHVQLFETPWTEACQASLSSTIAQNLLKFMSTESVILPSHLILCHPLLLLPSVFLTIRVFPNKSTLCIKWLNDWSFSFSISPSNEYTGLISFRTDSFDLLVVQGTLKSLLQHHRHQYFGALPSLWSNSPSVHDYWKDHCLDYMDLCQQGDVFAF